MPSSTLRDQLRPGTLPLRAAALTYYTFLALVPLRGLTLAILEFFGLERFALEVRHFILGELGVARTASVELGSLINRADARAISSFSGILFLLSGAALIWNIEAALNEIFRAGKPRPIGRRALAYLGLFTLGPLCLGLSLFLTALWRGSPLGRAPVPGLTLVIGPFGLALAGLFLLYRFGPNAKVSSIAAGAGALIAGPCWELAKQGYASLAVRAYHRDAAIYGSLASIPVLLLWLQVSWILILAGARLTAAVDALRSR